jgi:hypothetical protein
MSSLLSSQRCSALSCSFAAGELEVGERPESLPGWVHCGRNDVFTVFSPLFFSSRVFTLRTLVVIPIEEGMISCISESRVPGVTCCPERIAK